MLTSHSGITKLKIPFLNVYSREDGSTIHLSKSPHPLSGLLIETVTASPESAFVMLFPSES